MKKRLLRQCGRPTSPRNDYRSLASNFNGTLPQAYSLASNTDITLGGGGDFTVCGWAKQNSPNAAIQTILWKGVALVNTSEYGVRFAAGGTTLTVTVGSGTASASPTSAAFPLGSWVFFVLQYSSATGQVGVSVNGGPFVLTALTGTPLAAANPLSFGKLGVSNTLFLNGCIDSVWMWKRLLTPSEIMALYNQGCGMRYINAAASLKTSLVSCWEHDELYGIRYDAHGANHLSNSAMVSIPGVLGKAIGSDGVGSYLVANTNSNVELGGGGSFSIAVWMKTNTTTLSHVITKGNSGATATEYTIRFGTGGTSPTFIMSDGTSLFQAVDAANIPIGTWCLVFCIYDSVAKTMSIQVNNRAPVSVAFLGTPTLAAPLGLESRLTFGRNGMLGTAYLNGGIDSVWFWKRAITTAEKVTLYNGGLGYAYNSANTSLNTSLVAHWGLNEVGLDTYSDTLGVAPLVDPWFVQSVQGVVRNHGPEFSAAAIFDGVSNYLTVPSSADVTLGGGADFTMAGWVNVGSLTDDMCIIAKGATSPTSEILLRTRLSAGLMYLRFYISNGTTLQNVISGVVPMGGWAHFVLQYDSAASKIAITINAQDTVEAAFTGTPTTNSAPMVMGQRVSDFYYGGGVQGVWIWKRLLTTQEKRDHYNDGEGLRYSKAATPLKTGVSACWELDERSGQRRDSKGTNHLSEVGTVASMAGAVGRAFDPKNAYPQQQVLRMDTSLVGAIESAVGIPLTVDGTSVYRWNDFGPIATPATQTTEIRKPFKYTANGQPYIRFDGTDDHLALSSTALNTTSRSVFLVARYHTIQAAGTRPFLAPGGANWYVGRGPSGLYAMASYQNTASVQKTVYSASDNFWSTSNFKAATFTQDASSAPNVTTKEWANGVLFTNVTNTDGAAVPVLATWSIGAFFTSNQNAAVDFAALIVWIFPIADALRAKLEKYYSDRFGFPLT